MIKLAPLNASNSSSSTQAPATPVGESVQITRKFKPLVLAGIHTAGNKYYGYNEKIATSGSIRRPDGIVARRAERDPHDFVTDPIIIFEVISSFTSATDRISKNREYESTPSIQRYVILELARAAATVFSRCNGEWTGWLLLQDELLSLPEIGLKIPLAELYDA